MHPDFKTQLLAVLALFSQFTVAFSEELRTRLSEPTWQKFTAMASEFQALQPLAEAMEDKAQPHTTLIAISPEDLQQFFDSRGLTNEKLESLIAKLVAGDQPSAEQLAANPAA